MRKARFLIFVQRPETQEVEPMIIFLTDALNGSRLAKRADVPQWKENY